MRVFYLLGLLLLAPSLAFSQKKNGFPRTPYSAGKTYDLGADQFRMEDVFQVLRTFRRVRPFLREFLPAYRDGRVKILRRSEIDTVDLLDLEQHNGHFPTLHSAGRFVPAGEFKDWGDTIVLDDLPLGAMALILYHEGKHFLDFHGDPTTKKLHRWSSQAARSNFQGFYDRGIWALDILYNEYRTHRDVADLHRDMCRRIPDFERHWAYWGRNQALPIINPRKKEDFHYLLGSYGIAGLINEMKKASEAFEIPMFAPADWFSIETSTDAPAVEALQPFSSPSELAGFYGDSRQFYPKMRMAIVAPPNLSLKDPLRIRVMAEEGTQDTLSPGPNVYYDVVLHYQPEARVFSGSTGKTRDHSSAGLFFMLRQLKVVAYKKEGDVFIAYRMEGIHDDPEYGVRNRPESYEAVFRKFTDGEASKIAREQFHADRIGILRNGFTHNPTRIDAKLRREARVKGKNAKEIAQLLSRQTVVLKYPIRRRLTSPTEASGPYEATPGIPFRKSHNEEIKALATAETARVTEVSDSKIEIKGFLPDFPDAKIVATYDPHLNGFRGQLKTRDLKASAFLYPVSKDELRIDESDPGWGKSFILRISGSWVDRDTEVNTSDYYKPPKRYEFRMTYTDKSSF